MRIFVKLPPIKKAPFILKAVKTFNARRPQSIVKQQSSSETQMHMPNSLSPKAISNEKGERQSNFTKTNPKETLSVIFFTSTTSESSFSRFPPDARKSFPGALLDGIVRCRPNFAFNAPLFYNRFR